jgi:hypothetical protein
MAGRDALSPPADEPKELLPQTDAPDERTLQRADALRQAGVRFPVPPGGIRSKADISPQSTAEEACVNVLFNPQLDVVEFGDGTGSVDYWSILFQNVYFDNDDYNSPSHSLVLVDEPPGSDPPDNDLVDIEGEIWDLDQFGQGFLTPPDLTRVVVSGFSVYANPNENDVALSWLYWLTPDGYLDDWIAYAPIPEATGGFTYWFWELTASEYPDLLADMSNQLLAVVYVLISDRQGDIEVIWLDDLQVTLCYDRQSAVYLPLLARQPYSPPQPTCSPREPDSVAQPGSTTVDVTCGGSLNNMDQKDYYTLDLDGANRVRLHLRNLPSGTNWDALIYENKSGYPLACQIGTPGDSDKRSDNCNVNPSKNYFVLVSRGPNQTGGSYEMEVERR